MRNTATKPKPSHIYRLASKDDMPAVFALVKDLAHFEDAGPAFQNDEAQFTNDYTSSGAAHWFRCIVAETLQGEIIGTAVFFEAYSTWRGRLVYLDDLFVMFEYRGQGIGSALLHEVLAYAKTVGAKYLKWQAYDNNQRALAVYETLGAEFEHDCVNCRLEVSPDRYHI